MPRWDVHFDVRVDNGSVEVRALVATIHAVAGLTREVALPPMIDARLNALNILRAVRGTTGIEGSQLTEEEVGEIVDNPKKSVLPPHRKREEQEARNAHKVIEYVRTTKDTAISEPLISTIHRLTTQGINYRNNIPGTYRSHPTVAGDYLPPDTNDSIRTLMAKFVEWINTGERANWDPIIRAVVSHFYLVSIHPFGDGNGRTARGIEAFVLYRGGINVRGFYSLANYYYQHRDEYIDKLDFVRFQSAGDLTPFVLFALRGLEGELSEVRRQVMEETRAIAFRDLARERIFGAEGPEHPDVILRMFKLVQAIADHDGFTLADLRAHAPYFAPEYKKLGDRTLNRDVKRLQDLSLVTMEGTKEGTKVNANIHVMDHFAYPTTSAISDSTAPPPPSSQSPDAAPR